MAFPSLAPHSEPGMRTLVAGTDSTLYSMYSAWHRASSTGSPHKMVVAAPHGQRASGTMPGDAELGSKPQSVTIVTCHHSIRCVQLSSVTPSLW